MAITGLIERGTGGGTIGRVITRGLDFSGGALSAGASVQVVQSGGIACHVVNSGGTAVKVVTASATKVTISIDGGTAIRVTI